MEYKTIRTFVTLFLTLGVIQAQECPDTSGIASACVIDPELHCFGDHQCRHGYKCCSYGCNRRCLAVNYIPIIHLGSCRNAGPLVNPKTCIIDSVCRSNEKCCSFRCAVVRPFIVPIN